MRQPTMIETERLLLRPPGLDDFEDSAGMWSDPAVTRHIGGKPSTREEAWGRLLRYAGHWSLLGYGYWVVRRRLTGEFVGEVGFGDHGRELAPAFDGAPELGWALARTAQGRGFATEAVMAALEWAKGHWKGGIVVCMISPDNGVSLRVAAKAGFAPTTRTVYKGAPVILFSRPLRAAGGCA